MSVRQEIFELGEVDSIGCLCRQCESEFIIKLSKNKFFGTECPNCGNAWHPLPEVLSAFVKLQERIKDATLTIRLRTKATESA